MKNKPICIIPARGGSKRIKNKNIIKIGGKPLIEHTIKIAKKSKIFSEIIVSTDSKKIAKIAKSVGAKIPFLRQKELSGPKITIKKTIIDCINRINSHNVPFHCCLMPTAILISPKDLQKAFKKMKKEKLDTVLSVTENKTFFRSLIKKNKYFDFFWKSYTETMSQDLQPGYTLSGSFTFFRTKKYMESKRSFPIKTSVYILAKDIGIDLDDSKDLKFLKMIYNYKKFLSK